MCLVATQVEQLACNHEKHTTRNFDETGNERRPETGGGLW